MKNKLLMDLSHLYLYKLCISRLLMFYSWHMYPKRFELFPHGTVIPQEINEHLYSLIIQ